MRDNRQWNEKFGNNFTDNVGMHNDMMQVNNIMTGGAYQAKVSGDYGEFTVASVLKSLPPQFHLLNDYLIQTRKGSTQLDHIMVCPYGVFVIETKNHKGRIYGDVRGKVWTQVLVGNSVQRNKFYSPYLQNRGHVYHLIKEVGLNPKYITGLIVFTNSEADLSTVNCDCCFTLETLYQYFMNLMKYSPIILNDESIYKIIERLDKTNTNGYLNAEKHVNFVNEMHKRNEKRY